jgi:hypothetical protein
MTDEIVLGPLLYAFLKGLKAYNEAKQISGNVVVEDPADNLFLKMVSSFTGEMQKYSDAPAPDFLKKYKTYESVLNVLLKMLG